MKMSRDEFNDSMNRLRGDNLISETPPTYERYCDVHDKMLEYRIYRKVAPAVIAFLSDEALTRIEKDYAYSP